MDRRMLYLLFEGLHPSLIYNALSGLHDLNAPLVYVLTFLAAVFIQKKAAINDAIFRLQLTKLVGILILAISLVFLYTSLRKFFLTKNTLILIKPAASLQTTGIYNISRNPMSLRIFRRLPRRSST